MVNIPQLYPTSVFLVYSVTLEKFVLLTEYPKVNPTECDIFQYTIILILFNIAKLILNNRVFRLILGSIK